MKKLSTVIVLLMLSSLGFSQSHFGSSFAFGTSITYWGEHDKFTYINHDEFTWNLNASMKLAKRVHLGVQALSIFSNGGNTEYVYHNLIGCFVQIDVFGFDQSRFFLETSINRGNYLLSNTSLYPQKENGMYYLGWGGGVELPLHKLHKQLYLDLSFISYHNLDYLKEADAFTQYIIGVNYKFGRH